MINIVDILKDCPKGTKLYSPICGECRLIKIYDGLGFDVITDTDAVFNFAYDGRYYLNGECCIFPSKDNRDWNTFRPFKDGDIISNASYIAIFHKFGKPKVYGYDKVVYYHCWCYQNGKGFKFEKDYGIGRDTDFRFATDEEKQKLFNVIKENGYKWNPETKTLEKLIVGDKIHPWTIQDAKDGDVIFYDDGWTCIFKRIHGIWYSSYCFITNDGEFYTGYEEHAVDSTINGNAHPATKEQCNLLFQKMKESGYKWNAETKILEKLIVPKFKVGDIVKSNRNTLFNYKIIKITDTHYTLESIPKAGTYDILICEDENWKLVPKKFDITTLKPFESKVLVRDVDYNKWEAAIFGRYDGEKVFVIGGLDWNQCIPYEGNEHLLGTNNDCDEYYKNW